MSDAAPLPIIGLALVAVGCAGLLVLDVAPVVVGTVALIWACSLWITSASPPPSVASQKAPAFTPDTMRELIEHSASPLLICKNNRVQVANLSARQVLGAHVVGQDARVAFRQPEAVKLLGDDRNGVAVVRGLARRRDIWRVSKQKLGGTMFVIELSNRTAEADITRAHTDFVANASHELRTPLSSIIGYVETMLEDDAGLDEATRHRFLNTVSKEARRLQNLVNDLMSLSRVEAEKHDNPEITIEFPALIERAARDAAGAERLHRLHFGDLAAARLLGDPQQLEQLVRNLVDNALKYGDAAREILIGLSVTQDNFAELTVRDHGDGIAAEHLPHLTRRFYRTDPGRSRASGGTGLGLAIVKHIVERHRGRLNIESVRAEGTTVTVSLPSIAPVGADSESDPDRHDNAGQLAAES